jgi:phosphoinositide-3-kinase regulatory subunit 4
VPFDLSQLLSFCAGEYEPSQAIEKIECEHGRKLVSHMIQIVPGLRSNAQEYLTQFRGTLFPEIFYTSLQSYYDILAFQPLIKPDARMARLYQDVK